MSNTNMVYGPSGQMVRGGADRTSDNWGTVGWKAKPALDAEAALRLLDVRDSEAVTLHAGDALAIRNLLAQLTMSRPALALDLEAIRTRWEAAADGTVGDVAHRYIAGPNARYEVVDDEGRVLAETWTEADAAFVAHARSDVPALLVAVEQRDRRVLALAAEVRDATSRHALACKDLDEARAEIARLQQRVDKLTRERGRR